MSFVWRYTPQVDPAEIGDPPPSFANQSDAESWIGEAWRELAEAGVQSVALYDDGTEMYQMPLGAD